MKRIAIFASGSGSNAQNIIGYFAGRRDVLIDSLWSNNENAYALIRAERLGVETFTFNREDLYQSSDVLDELEDRKIDLIVLAGFLWLLPRSVVEEFPVLNIHPALLPKYGGKGMFGRRVHQAVLDAGEKESGITIHRVNAHYDEGAVLFQQAFLLEKGETPETLTEKVHRLEFEYYPQVIEKFLFEDID